MRCQNHGMTEPEGPRVVIVTGAAGGIGTHIVEAFEREGDTAVGLDIEWGFDLRDPETCQAEARRIHDEHGREWTDVSTWFWDATLLGVRGPWWSTVRVTRAKE